MADVKWIKIVTDIFDNKKIKQIECLPDGDGIIVIWFKLLCLAGNTNDNGMVYFTKDIPYTEQMLAAQFNRPLTLVQIALNTFQRFGMIDVVDDILYVSNWEKYQSVDRLREIREYNRLAQKKSREKKKLLQNVNDVSMTSQHCHDTDKDKEKELDTDIDIDLDSEGDIEYSTPQAEAMSVNCPYAKIKELYHKICISYPKIKTIDGNRKTAVGARWRTYKSLDVFEELFTIAETTPFLKGENNNNWSADFDWMMKPTNFSKILEHKYDDRSSGNAPLTGAIGTLAKMYEEAGGNDGTGNY